jgi:S-formylglutathione hydrolase FrmB
MKKVFLVVVMLVVAVSFSFSGNVDFQLVHSKAMDKDIPVVVISPENNTSRKPVIYLLHGYGDNETSFPIIKPNLSKIADKYGVIFVSPRGEKSWYFDSPINPKMLYETFISKELVEFVDKNYKTISNRSGRAITGFSMGGHGAVWNAMRHKNVFGAAGSMSGAFSIRSFAELTQEESGFSIGDILGTEEKTWLEYSVLSIIDNPKFKSKDELALIIDIGYDDNAFGVPLYQMNNYFHRKLIEKKIEHSYFVYPGGHTINYWNNALDYQILFFVKYFGLSDDDILSSK